MSRVVLSRLWYIFPPDDQNLRPEQFARKVRSYARTLALREQRMLLEFLVVQYEAFQKQLELLFAHASVQQLEYQERAGRLVCYLDHLHAFLRSPDLVGARELPERLIACQHGTGSMAEPVREERRAHPMRRGPAVPGPLN